MNKQDIIKTIAAVISKVTDIPVEDIHPDSALMDDLELSSLEIMTMLPVIEKTFGIRVNEKALRNIITVSDMAEGILKLKG